MASTLTSAPSIMNRLVTEPLPEDDQGPVLNAMSFDLPSLGGFFNPVAGAIVNAGVNIFPGIHAGAGLIPLDQLVRLGVNSPQFYSFIGAGAAIQVMPPQVIVNQAQDAHRDYPSQWYVNFPHNMSGHDAEAVLRSRKSMTNFRSWSSKKWWEEVSRRFGVADEAIQRARQSKQFAQIACEDMVRMSWLRTTRPPNTMSFSINCDPGELHGRLVQSVMAGWSNVDNDLVEAVEPIFRDIVNTALKGNMETSQMNNVVMEKYVYSDSTQSITSYIRLLSFELHEAVYDVIRGKRNERQSRVSVDFSFCLYEAVFEAALWEQFSATLHDDETNLLWDYVHGQTIDLQSGR